MKVLVERIDAKFKTFGYFIVKRKFAVLVFMLVMMGLMIMSVPKLVIDTSTEGFLHKDDPARIDYDKFRDQFGRDEKIVIAIKTDDVFKPKNLQKLKKLHNELKNNVPYLNDITSLINARNTQGTEDALIVEDLFLNWPETDQELARLKEVAVNNPMYVDLLMSEDATFTVIVLESNTYTSLGQSSDNDLEGFDEAVTKEAIPFITDVENSAMVAAASAIVKKYKSDDFKIYLAGSPSVTAFLKSSMMKDMAKFNGLIILIIIVFLGLLFRRMSGVVIPILVVLLAVVATMGLMAFTHTSVSTMTQIIPSFLLAVGVGGTVHILAIFYKDFDTHKDKCEAIANTLEHSGFAIVMTSLTTAAGIASFSFSQIATVADLGIFGAIGVLIVLSLTLILLPAILAILPMKPKELQIESEHHDKMDGMLKFIALFSHKHAKAIVVSSIAFMIVTVMFALHINYSHNPLKWFKEDHAVRIATEIIDKELKGSVTLEIIVDTKKENGLYDYKILKKLEAMAEYAMSLQSTINGTRIEVGKAVSVVDVIKEVHRALNENRPDFYAIPENEKLISQEMLLFENSGSDDLEDFVDSQFSMARITAKIAWVDAYAYHEILHKMQKHIDENFDESVEVRLTGLIPLLATTISKAIDSSGWSYLLAFVVIALMMMLILGSIPLGLLSMIPNLFPVMIVLALMVIFDLPLDMFTMLIGSIVIGLAVDDTVHFMHNFMRYYHQNSETQGSITHALTGTGRAMLITSIVLSLGFFVYAFSTMNNLFAFGLLTGIAIIAALLADFFIAPALLALYFKKQRKTL